MVVKRSTTVCPAYAARLNVSCDQALRLLVLLHVRSVPSNVPDMLYTCTRR